MTNKTISLTIPNDDPIALHEFGAAMQRMAGRHGLEVQQPAAVEIRPERETAIREAIAHDTDKAQLAALGDAAALDVIKSHVTAKHFEVTCPECDMSYVGTTDRVGKPCERCATTNTVVTSSPQVDSDGLPWDARIHASSKERNADDTWRARRKPSDMDAGQWAEFQGQVRTELRALMELPVEQEVVTVLDEQPVEVTFGEPKVASLTTSGELSVGYVVEPVEPEPIVVTPPPVVAPPTPVEPVAAIAPPVPTGTGQDQYVECLIKLGVSTETAREMMSAGNPAALFVPFLQWITSSGITPEQVNVALAQHGLTAVPQLQQRPDLIPQVHATLAAGV